MTEGVVLVCGNVVRCALQAARCMLHITARCLWCAACCMLHVASALGRSRPAASAAETWRTRARPSRACTRSTSGQAVLAQMWLGVRPVLAQMWLG
jgi:hypothetical protein